MQGIILNLLDKYLLYFHNGYMDIFLIVQDFGEVLDLVGVVIIVTGVVASSLIFLKDWFTHQDHSYKIYRQNLGKVILLGLELLVAGDIIRSVAGKPDFTSVAVLGMIVLIRSFLSITFDMEVEGRWPWQKGIKK